MKKLKAAILIVIFTLININYTIADNRRHGGGGNRSGGNYKHGGGGYYNRGNYHRGRYNNYGPRRRYGGRRYGGYIRGGYRGWGGWYGDNAAYAIGGFLIGATVGSLITNEINRSNYDPGYSSNPYSTPTQYVMQPDGRCYMVSYINNGKMVLSPVYSGNCH